MRTSTVFAIISLVVGISPSFGLRSRCPRGVSDDPKGKMKLPHQQVHTSTSITPPTEKKYVKQSLQLSHLDHVVKDDASKRQPTSGTRKDKP
ncbi:hypothetical protein F5148DRAFT_1278776 [Russula earlei]|uniref:Uncharacterized protein n=1 Tax=Russula earlei TaxID=71964 RepID=A0ACC0UNW8_9AGAM|nr:hypothetical protein F5148DRAFT_1278776 [Russula earlei]